jgi:N utilization substance protein B
MINRRLLRIKVFKILFGRVYSGKDSYQAAEKELIISCEKTLDLLYLLLLLPYELKKIAVEKIETGKSKFHPTPEESNPNMKFVNNRFTEKLENCKALNDYCEKKGLSWSQNRTFIKNLLKILITRDYYIEYMNSGTDSWAEDRKLFSSFYREELEDNDDLYEILEDMNIYWADDIVYTADVILRMLPQIKADLPVKFPEAFIQEDDRFYALRLLTHSMLHFDEYVGVMSGYVLNWEPDRLASTDTCLIVMGISEAVAFPTIPLKVTINEFVEISKYYSTNNSKVFVNGILEKVLLGMQNEGKIEKEGRGLVGSID